MSASFVSKSPSSIAEVLMAEIMASNTSTLAVFWFKEMLLSEPSRTSIATIASLTTSTTVAIAAATR